MTKASKRTERLNRMFGGIDADALAEQAAKEGKPAKRPTTTAPTQALQDSFANIEAENIRLKSELEKAQIHEIDPDKVQASLIQDRFEWSDKDPEFQSLLKSIESEGQQLPILVRPHPLEKGQYQLAYGARRSRACKLLERPVRAYVQELTDEQLIVAQGLENNERKNLSFIEQAIYATSLSAAGFARKVIAKAIGITDETNVSKMLGIVKRTPADIIQMIGAAPKIGRNRWEAFSAIAENGQKKPAIFDVLRALPESDAWKKADSNKRFDIAFRTAEKADKFRTGKPKANKLAVEYGGRQLGMLERSDKQLRLTVNLHKEPEFAEFLEARIESLVSEFNEQNGGSK